MNEIGQTRTPAEEDARTEAAVLRWLLALHPVRITFAELLREVCADPDDFAQRDAVDRAVRDLGQVGLVHRGDELVAPSRAALRFAELDRL
jgi:hypothetical protein